LTPLTVASKGWIVRRGERRSARASISAIVTMQMKIVRSIGRSRNMICVPSGAQALPSAASPSTITGVSRKRASPNARRPPSSTKLASTIARSNGCDVTASLALLAVGFESGSNPSASSQADSISPSSAFGVATMTCWRNGMPGARLSSNRASRFVRGSRIRAAIP
jgi:hypothetical protein